MIWFWKTYFPQWYPTSQVALWAINHQVFMVQAPWLLGSHGRFHPSVALRGHPFPFRIYSRWLRGIHGAQGTRGGGRRGEDDFDDNYFLSDCDPNYFWLVVLNMTFIFPYIAKNHPNWLLFFRGVETTNQICFCYWQTITNDYWDCSNNNDQWQTE